MLRRSAMLQWPGALDDLLPYGRSAISGIRNSEESHQLQSRSLLHLATGAAAYRDARCNWTFCRLGIETSTRLMNCALLLFWQIRLITEPSWLSSRLQATVKSRDTTLQDSRQESARLWCLRPASA